MARSRTITRAAVATVLFALSQACSGSSQPNQSATGSSAAPASSTAAAAQPGGTSAASGGERVELGTGTLADLVADYEKQCPPGSKPSRTCIYLDSFMSAKIELGLDDIARTGDQRGVDVALDALDLSDDPNIQVAAIRVLGQFPKTAGIAAKALPLVLDSPYVEVQRMAAQLLQSTPDENASDVGRLWLERHHGFDANSPYDEYPDFPPHYAKMNFPAYPGAKWFSPVDSDRSIGWSTTDDTAAVAKWFADKLRAQPKDGQQWQQYTNEIEMRLLVPDPARTARFQQVMQRAMAGDQAAAAELEKLSKEQDDISRQADEKIKKSLFETLRPANSGYAGAKWIVAEEKAGRPVRAVLVYRLLGVNRTVIQFAWDLQDFPSAWPQPRER